MTKSWFSQTISSVFLAKSISPTKSSRFILNKSIYTKYYDEQLTTVHDHSPLIQNYMPSIIWIQIFEKRVIYAIFRLIFFSPFISHSSDSANFCWAFCRVELGWRDGQNVWLKNGRWIECSTFSCAYSLGQQFIRVQELWTLVFKMCVLFAVAHSSEISTSHQLSIGKCIF